jgi:hypothetical protein
MENSSLMIDTTYFGDGEISIIETKRKREADFTKNSSNPENEYEK